MLTGIDHLVIAVPDLDAAVDRLGRELGIAAGGGGTHPGLGTANRIAWFGDSYLELITVTDRGLTAGSWLGGPTQRLLDERGGGFVGYALTSDDLAADLARLRAGGSTLSGPVPGERRRPDGAVARWTLGIPELVGPTAPPFLIEHDTGEAEWTASERAARAHARHPAGGPLRLAGLEISMVAPTRVAVAYRRAVGLHAEPWLAGGDWTLAVRVGAQQVVLAPADLSSEPTVTVRLAGPDVRPIDAELFACRFVIGPDDGSPGSA